VGASGVTPKLKALKIAGDIVLRPEDFDKGSVLAPSINGVYEDFITGDLSFGLLLNGNLSIQAPPTSDDTSKLVNRVLSSGGVGSFSLGVRGLTVNADTSRGFSMSASAAFQWQNSQITNGGTVSPKFSYCSYKLTVAGWYDVFFLSYTVSWQSIRDPSSYVEKQVGSGRPTQLVSGTLLIESYYLQLRYLIPPKGILKSSENVDVRLGYKFDFIL
jgi:hypothetical protein